MSNNEIDQYLGTLGEPKRATLAQLRDTIVEIVPDAEQCMSYGMPAFRLQGKTVAGFAAFKSHLSYLPHSGSVIPQLAKETEGYTKTKGSLHFPIDRPLPKQLVKKLLDARMAEAFGPRRYPQLRLDQARNGRRQTPLPSSALPRGARASIESLRSRRLGSWHRAVGLGPGRSPHLLLAALGAACAPAYSPS